MFKEHYKGSLGQKREEKIEQIEHLVKLIPTLDAKRITLVNEASLLTHTRPQPEAAAWALGKYILKDDKKFIEDLAAYEHEMTRIPATQAEVNAGIKPLADKYHNPFRPEVNVNPLELLDKIIAKLEKMLPQQQEPSAQVSASSTEKAPVKGGVEPQPENSR